MITRETIERKPRFKKILMIPLYPFIKLYYFIKMLMTPPIKRGGIHVIAGDTGGGKTLLASILSRYWSEKKGYKVVSNSRFNSKVKHIDINDYFGAFDQKKPLENCVVFFDEIQRNFNRRMNRRNDYNEIFIPLIDWLTIHRHNNIPAVYFLTQSIDLLDIQLGGLIQKFHFLHSKKSTSFYEWIRSDKIRPLIIPKQIHYFTKNRRDIKESDFHKYVTRKHELKYKKIKINKITVSINEFKDFKTFAFKRDLKLKADDTNKKSPQT